MEQESTMTDRKLTVQQRKLLQAFFSFRFATTNLLAALQPKPISTQALNKRLRLLHDQGYVAKREPDRLSFGSQHVTWCLAANGIAALKEMGVGSPHALRNLRKDVNASDPFAQYCIGIFAVHNELRAAYGQRLTFLTRSFLFGKYLFPDPLPGAYIVIKSGEAMDSTDGDGGVDESYHTNISQPKQYLLEYVDPGRPQKYWKERFKQLLAYIEDGEWEETDTDPALLFVCATPWLEQRVQGWVRKAYLDNELEYAKVYVTNVQNVAAVLAKAEHEKSPEANSSSRALKWTGY